MTTDSLVAEATRLLAAHNEPWPGDGNDGYQCGGCQRDLWLRSSEYEPRGLCDTCLADLVAEAIPALLAALAESQRETAKMRAVYEAALAWRAFSQRQIVEANLTDGWSVHIRLGNAIDAAIAAEVKP